jgi:hypothetical protein
MSSPPDPAPVTTAAPAAVVTDFAWAKAQMQQGKQVKRAGWQGKTVFLSTSGNEVMRLPQGFPFGGAVVPWLYEPGDTDATDWEIAK